MVKTLWQNIWLLLFFVGTLCGAAQAQTLVNSGNCFGSSSAGCTVNLSVTAGNGLVVFVDTFGNGDPTVTLNGVAMSLCSAGSKVYLNSYQLSAYCGQVATTNASAAISSSGRTYDTVIALQYSSCCTFDAVAVSTSTTAETAQSTSVLTTAQDGELLVGAFHENTNGYGFTAGTGYTIENTRSSSSYMAAEDKTAGTAGSYDATITYGHANTYRGIVVALQQVLTASPPSISPNGVPLGYAVPQSVTLTSSTSGATIIYTTDGSLPTSDAACVATNGTTLANGGSFNITGYGLTTVRAMACKSGYSNSGDSTADFDIYQDQTGTNYSISDNMQDYYNSLAKDQHQMPLQAAATAGKWSAAGTVDAGSPQVEADATLGGSNVEMYQSGNVGTKWAEYTGHTGWAASGTGEYASGYVHTSTGDSGCTYVYSDHTNKNGYAFCYVKSGPTVYVYRIDGGTATTLDSAALALSDGDKIELRGIPGYIQPLVNDAQATGLSLYYADATYSTGNPGIGGVGLYSPTVGTMRASTPLSPISFTPTYSSYGPFACDTSGSTDCITWPWSWSTAGLNEVQSLNTAVPNTSVSADGSTVVIGSMLDPGVGVQVQLSGMDGFTGNNGGGLVVTTTASDASSFSFSSTKTMTANTGISQSGTTVTVTNIVADHLSVGGKVYVSGVFPFGYNGLWDVTGTSPGANQFTYEAPAGLGSVTALGTSVLPGQSATFSSSYAMGKSSPAIGQEHHWGVYSPAQWILATIAVDTTSTTVQNWFLKLNGNTANTGEACYDQTGYYIGEEPMWQQNGGTPPYPNPCAGTVEYCGTIYLHITKDTPVTNQNPPAGGCGSVPNFNIWTVSGSSYVVMAGDQILAMYTPQGFLDVYCKGTANSANAPFGLGCPSTTNFYRVIHALDLDLIDPTPTGIAQGAPGVWSATEGTTMAVFQDVRTGSVTGGVSCASITGAQCIVPASLAQQGWLQ